MNAVSIYLARLDVDRNLVVASGGHFDRSPSETDTAARMVCLHHAGGLSVGELFRTESVIGSSFEGRIRRRKRRDGRTGVLPEITGSAYLTVKQTFFDDMDNPIVGFNGFRDGSTTLDRTMSDVS